MLLPNTIENKMAAKLAVGPQRGKYFLSIMVRVILFLDKLCLKLGNK